MHAECKFNSITPIILGLALKQRKYGMGEVFNQPIIVADLPFKYNVKENLDVNNNIDFAMPSPIAEGRLNG